MSAKLSIPVGKGEGPRPMAVIKGGVRDFQQVNDHVRAHGAFETADQLRKQFPHVSFSMEPVAASQAGA